MLKIDAIPSPIPTMSLMDLLPPPILAIILESLCLLDLIQNIRLVSRRFRNAVTGRMLLARARDAMANYFGFPMPISERLITDHITVLDVLQLSGCFLTIRNQTENSFHQAAGFLRTLGGNGLLEADFLASQLHRFNFNGDDKDYVARYCDAALVSEGLDIPGLSSASAPNILWMTRKESVLQLSRLSTILPTRARHQAREIFSRACSCIIRSFSPSAEENTAQHLASWIVARLDSFRTEKMMTVLRLFAFPGFDHVILLMLPAIFKGHIQQRIEYLVSQAESLSEICHRLRMLYMINHLLDTCSPRNQEETFSLIGKPEELIRAIDTWTTGTRTVISPTELRALIFNPDFKRYLKRRVDEITDPLRAILEFYLEQPGIIPPDLTPRLRDPLTERVIIEDILFHLRKNGDVNAEALSRCVVHSIESGIRMDALIEGGCLQDDRGNSLFSMLKSQPGLRNIILNWTDGCYKQEPSLCERLPPPGCLTSWLTMLFGNLSRCDANTLRNLVRYLTRYLNPSRTFIGAEGSPIYIIGNLLMRYSKADLTDVLNECIISTFEKDIRSLPKLLISSMARNLDGGTVKVKHLLVDFPRLWSIIERSKRDSVYYLSVLFHLPRLTTEKLDLLNQCHFTEREDAFEVLHSAIMILLQHSALPPETFKTLFECTYELFPRWTSTARSELYFPLPGTISHPLEWEIDGRPLAERLAWAKEDSYSLFRAEDNQTRVVGFNRDYYREYADTAWINLPSGITAISPRERRNILKTVKFVLGYNSLPIYHTDDVVLCQLGPQVIYASRNFFKSDLFIRTLLSEPNEIQLGIIPNIRTTLYPVGAERLKLFSLIDIIRSQYLEGHSLTEYYLRRHTHNRNFLNLLDEFEACMANGRESELRALLARSGYQGDTPLHTLAKRPPLVQEDFDDYQQCWETVIRCDPALLHVRNERQQTVAELLDQTSRQLCDITAGALLDTFDDVSRALRDLTARANDVRLEQPMLTTIGHSASSPAFFRARDEEDSSDDADQEEEAAVAAPPPAKKYRTDSVLQ